MSRLRRHLEKDMLSWWSRETAVDLRGGSPMDDVVALPVKDPSHIARCLLLLNALEHTDPAPIQETTS